MNPLRQNILAAGRHLARACAPTPGKIYNLSVLAGLGLVSTGMDQVAGRGAALIAAGALVLALGVFERLQLRSRR